MDDEPRRWETMIATIGHAYHTFQHYKLVEPILCEMSGRVIVPMDVPLRQRTPADLKYYQWKAMTSLGAVDDYKHFLPRLLQLNTEQHRRRILSREELSWDEFIGSSIDLDMIAMKLEYGKAASWPADECDALQSFGLARWWWELSLPKNFHGGTRDAITLLDSIGRPLLNHLDSTFDSLGDNEMLALARFINRNVEFAPKRARYYFTWGGDGGAEDPMGRWLLSPKVRAVLEAAFFRSPNPTDAETLSSAVQQLDWFPRPETK